MTGKTTVILNTAEGETKYLSGDTVMVFALDNIKGLLKRSHTEVISNVSYSGEKIPTPIFAEVIGNVICGLVRKIHDKQPMLAAYQLSAIADFLNEQCAETNKNIMANAKDQDELDDMVEGLLSQILI